MKVLFGLTIGIILFTVRSNFNLAVQKPMLRQLLARQLMNKQYVTLMTNSSNTVLRYRFAYVVDHVRLTALGWCMYNLL